tara:strand:- start:83 stop:1024 length:942 start_codon:yes stop_codon:yes gene_type:complete
MKIKLPKIYKSNFDILYSKYVSSKPKKEDQEVSSHWSKHLSNTLIRQINESDYVYIKPDGFDDYKINNIINKLINIPEYIYLSKYKNTLSRVVYNKMHEAIKLQGRILSYNCMKTALTLNYILSHKIDLNKFKVSIIGDGNGFLGILLKLLFPNIKIVHINLGKILLFDYLFTAKSQLFEELNTVYTKSDYKKNSDCSFVPAEKIFDISIDDIDFFFNIASMGEMNPIIIDNYFEFMRKQNTKDTYFYCCNRISKKLPDGTLTKFDAYQWSDDDKIIFDEKCNWYVYAPMSKPPFLKKFDGEFKHKLVILKKY